MKPVTLLASVVFASAAVASPQLLKHIVNPLTKPLGSVFGAVPSVVVALPSAVGDVTSQLGSVVGGVTSVPTATSVPIRVDTVGDSTGVPSSNAVASAKHLNFCFDNESKLFFCRSLNRYVGKCAGASEPPTDNLLKLRVSLNNTLYNLVDSADKSTVSPLLDALVPGCTTNRGLYLLQEAVYSAPCDSIVPSVDNGDLKLKLCKSWVGTATHCLDKEKRGPCGYHHIMHSLRRLSDFVAAPLVGT